MTYLGLIFFYITKSCVNILYQHFCFSIHLKTCLNGSGIYSYLQLSTVTSPFVYSKAGLDIGFAFTPPPPPFTIFQHIMFSVFLANLFFFTKTINITLMIDELHHS